MISEESDDDNPMIGRSSQTQAELQYQDSLEFGQAYLGRNQKENQQPNSQRSDRNSSGSQGLNNNSKQSKSNEEASSVHIDIENEDIDQAGTPQVVNDNRGHLLVPQLNLRTKSPAGGKQNVTESMNFNDKPFPRQITSPTQYLSRGFAAGSPIRAAGAQPVSTTNMFLQGGNRFLAATYNGGTVGSGRSVGTPNIGTSGLGHITNLNDSISTINQSLSFYQNVTQNLGTAGGSVVGASPVEVNDLKREMRKKESEFHKQTALLKQQVQLLEMQAKEFDSREAKLKRMHESMLKAVRDGGQQSSAGKKSIFSDQGAKEEYEETIAQKSNEISTMKDKLREQEYQYQNLSLQMEEKEIEAERKVQDLQLDKRNLENKIKRMENQISQVATSGEVLWSVAAKDAEIGKLKERMWQIQQQGKNESEKLKSINEEIVQQKDCQQKQIEFLQEQVELKEQQKETSLGRIQQLEEQVKSYEMQVEEMEQQLDEMTHVIQQKDQSMQQLQQTLDFNSSFDLTGVARANGATSERSNLQVQRLVDENEYLQSQIQSQQETIKNQQEQIIKYQNSENFSITDSEEKMREISTLKQQLEKRSQTLQTSLEKERQNNRQETSELKDQILKFKNQFEEEKNQHSAQLNEKDQEIERLNTLLETNQKSMHQSPIRLQNMSTLVASRDFQLSLQGMQYIGGGHHLKPVQNVSQMSGILPQGVHQAPLKGSMAPQDSTLDNSSQQIAKEECNNTLNLNTSHQFSHYPDQNFQTTGESINQIILESAFNMVYGQVGQPNMPGNLCIGIPMAGDDAFSHQLIDENGNSAGIYDLPRQQQPIGGNFSNSNIKIDFNNGGCTSASILQNDETEEEKVQIPLSELDLLQSCQKIIDAASSMKCIQCCKYFQTTDFYDHIIVSKECIIESDQSSENIIKDENQILQNDSNYFDELKKSQQHSDLILKSMSNSKGFYDALNMPLQTKDEGDYQTYNNNQNKVNSNESQSKPISSPFADNQIKVIQSDSKQSNNDFNQHYTRSTQKNQERDSKLKSKMVDIRSRSGGRGGHGSRSGMGCSGTAMTINSHILMSLSRSVTSRSNLSEQQSAKQNNVNQNFNNDQDNIRNLAQNLKNFTDQNLISDRNSYIQTSNERLTSRKLQDLHEHRNRNFGQDNEINNYLTNNTDHQQIQNQVGNDDKFNLMSCSDDNEGDRNDEHQYGGDGDILEEVDSAEEDNKINSKKSYNDPSDPQNILSQSLRDLVNNQIEENNFHTGHNEESNTNPNSQQMTLQNSTNQPHDHEIVEKLEKLYDLDTSRFEEEYSNLPSSKKRILLNQLGTDEGNSSKNKSRIQELEVNNSSSVHNFVDISKFNLSHDLNKEDKKTRNQANLSQMSINSKSKAKVKVVGINLMPTIHKTNKSTLGLTMEERAERGKDLPLSINDSRKKLNGTALAQNQINFFPKPSPKYQDDEITPGGMKVISGAVTADFSQLISHQGALAVSLRPSSSAAAINTSKLSESSLNQKPKFDLSKQINEINQKKLEREKTRSKEKIKVLEKQVKDYKACNIQLKKAKSLSNIKSVLKKPTLNIEIEDNYYDEEDGENMNKPLQIQGLGINVAGKEGVLNELLVNQKNVMESFRNYQNKLMQQTQGVSNVDLNQQFQSVSSKNGTQNFDFAAITGGGSAQQKHAGSYGPQPSSRRHAHGTNRYNQNGFMMVTSSSLNSDQPPDSNEMMNLPLQLQTNHSQASKSSQQVEPKTLFNNQNERIITSPYKPISAEKYIDKTAEQNANLRQMSQKYSQRRQEVQQQQQSGQFTDRRMDTSGVDINWGSEMNSPLSKRMKIPQNQTKAMKNLRAGGHFTLIQEEEKSETDGPEGGEYNESLCEEDQDEIGDLIEFEKANAIEGTAGFQSHRHQLGKQVVGLKPTLMTNTESRHYPIYDLQATKRDPAMLTNSEKQLIELRKQLLYSQLSQPGTAQPPQLASQGPVLTEELLHNYERERLLSIGSKGNLKMQTQKQFQPHLQRTSPKNSDYIKNSILLQSGSQSRKHAHLRNQHPNGLDNEECPSFFDELDFDEDHPVAAKTSKHDMLQNFQSTAPQHSSHDKKLKLQEQQHRPTTQKNQATRKDPLKNSLFHSFMKTQRSKNEQINHNTGTSYLKSYRDVAEDNGLLNQFKTNRSVFQHINSSRSNQFSIIEPNQYSTQNMHDSIEQPAILHGRRDGPGPPGSVHGGPAPYLLQTHQQTTALQRSRSNTKKQNIDQLTVNQSLGIINRPMMSNGQNISQSNILDSSPMSSSYQKTCIIQSSAIMSATKVQQTGRRTAQSQLGQTDRVERKMY